MPRLVNREPREPGKTPFGNNLRKLRQHMKWTQEHMAEFLSISRASLGSYEEGRALPVVKLQFEIAGKLSVIDVMSFLCNPDFDPQNQKPAEKEHMSLIEQRYSMLKDEKKAAVNALLGL